MAIRGPPLEEYFKLESTRLRDLTPLVANQYLAEDRLLAFEVVARPGRHWLLGWVASATAQTDVPQTLQELIKQRRVSFD